MCDWPFGDDDPTQVDAVDLRPADLSFYWLLRQPLAADAGELARSVVAKAPPRARELQLQSSLRRSIIEISAYNAERRNGERDVPGWASLDPSQARSTLDLKQKAFAP